MIRGGLVRLFVPDVDRAIRFYVETLGMKLVQESEPTSPTWAVLDAGEGFQIVLAKGTAAVGSVGLVGLGTKVPLEEAVAIYENRGVTFDVTEEAAAGAAADGSPRPDAVGSSRGSGAPLEPEGGSRRLAHFHDPDGNALFLFQE